MADKYWLAKKPGSELTAAQVEYLETVAKETAAFSGLSQGVAVADAAAMTFDGGTVDTGTDMTAAEAAQIVADLGELRTQLNALIAALETAGILATE